MKIEGFFVTKNDVIQSCAAAHVYFHYMKRNLFGGFAHILLRTVLSASSK